MFTSSGSGVQDVGCRTPFVASDVLDICNTPEKINQSLGTGHSFMLTFDQLLPAPPPYLPILNPSYSSQGSPYMQYLVHWGHGFLIKSID